MIFVFLGDVCLCCGNSIYSKGKCMLGRYIEIIENICFYGKFHVRLKTGCKGNLFRRKTVLRKKMFRNNR